MIIDWNRKEAEGCDWAMVNKSLRLVEFNKEKSVLNGNGFYDNEYMAERWEQYKRPKAKQMKETFYTKEMHERGQCCEVGMLFETEAGRYKSLFQNETSVVFEDENEFLVAIQHGLVKPIDTHTDREKAIDDIKRKIVNQFTVSPAIASVIFEEIRSGNIHGITFTGDK